jgi:hypothetical protein
MAARSRRGGKAFCAINRRKEKNMNTTKIGGKEEWAGFQYQAEGASMKRAVCFIFPELPLGYRLGLGFSEGFAVGMEAFFYALVFPNVNWKRSTVASLAANASSFGAGLLLYRFARTWMMQASFF